MAALTEEQKAGMRAATRSAAFALSDDLKHIREDITKDQPTAGDIRRLSTLLRRILLDGDLRTVAGPRMGKVMIQAPQLKPYHHANDKEPIYFFSGGKFEFKGGQMLGLHYGPRRLAIDHPPPDEVVDLNVEQFIAQRVICYKGRWASRTAIIKYVVVAAHAAHSADPLKDADYAFLHDLKHRVAIRLQNGFPGIEISDFPAEQNNKLTFDQERIDLALAQLHSTAMYLVHSPDIVELERLIDEEHGAL